MNQEVIVTCAVTGAGDTVGKHPAIPVTPQQIADAAIEAAKAGAAIAHMHVRDPGTGKGSRKTEYYREVVKRVRDSGTDIIINLTAGMGGDLEVDDQDPRKAGRARIWSTPWSAWSMSRSCCRRSARWIAARSISATAI